MHVQTITSVVAQVVHDARVKVNELEGISACAAGLSERLLAVALGAGVSRHHEAQELVA